MTPAWLLDKRGRGKRGRPQRWCAELMPLDILGSRRFAYGAGGLILIQWSICRWINRGMEVHFVPLSPSYM